MSASASSNQASLFRNTTKLAGKIFEPEVVLGRGSLFETMLVTEKRLLELKSQNDPSLKTTISDLKAALSIIKESVESFSKHNMYGKLNVALQDVTLAKEALKNSGDAISNSDDILAALDKFDDLEVVAKRSEQAYGNLLKLNGKLKSLNKTLDKGGKALSIGQTALEINEFVKSARDGQIDYVEALEAATSTLKTTVEFVGGPAGKLAVDVTDSVVNLAVISTDIYGDAVRSRQEAASSVITQTLFNHNVIIKNKLLDLQSSGRKIDNKLIRSVIASTSIDTKKELEFKIKDDVSALSGFIYGVSSKKYYDDAISLLDELVVNPQSRTAIVVNWLTKRNATEKLSQSLSSIQGSLNAEDVATFENTIVRRQISSNLEIDNGVSDSETSEADTSNSLEPKPDTLENTNNAQLTENENLEEDRERNKKIVEQRIRKSNQDNQELKKREHEIRSTRSEQTSLNIQRSELQAELQNKRNELTRLKFGEVERVQNELRSISAELNDLRIRKNASIAPNSALRRQQEKFSEEIRYLQGAINIRNNITTPSSVTKRQKDALNALARRLLVRANGQQEPWQVLLLQANFLLSDRRNKLGDVSRRIRGVEANSRFTDADDRRLQDLVRRQAELENRQGTIASRISQARSEISLLENELSSIGQQLDLNNQRLLVLNAELENFEYQIPSFDDQLLQDTQFINEDFADEEKVEFTQNTQPEQTISNDDPIIIPPVVDIPTTPTPNRSFNPTFGFVTGGNTSNNGNSNVFVVGVQEGSVNTDQGLEAVSLSFGDNRGRNQIVTIDANPQGEFSYLTWGQTDQSLSRFFPTTQFTHTLQNSFWILGQETPVNNLAVRMGTATFSGDIYGHFIDSTLGANGNFYDAVTGDVQFVADFSDDTLSGQGVFHIDTPNLDTSENFTIQGSLSDNNSGSFRTVSSNGNTNANFSASSSANVVSQIEGNNGQGYLLGSFYGSEVQEFGGAIGYFGNDGESAITGIVAAQERNGLINPLPQPEPTNNNDNFPFLGFVAGKIEGESSLFTGNLYTGLEGGGDAPLGSRGEARINRNGTNTFYSDNVDPSIRVQINESENADGFRYSDWGEWNGRGLTVANFSGAPAERGFYVIGQSTNSNDIPRSGSAEYNGEVRGIAFSGENIGGTVNLNANFSQRNVSARLGLTREDGSRWVNVQTGNLSYERSLSQNFEVNFGGNNTIVFDVNGNRIDGAGANVRGMFVGPNAEEIIGDFAIGGVPDDVGGVDGVFRASQGNTPLVNNGRPADGGPIVDLPRDIGVAGSGPGRAGEPIFNLPDVGGETPF